MGTADHAGAREKGEKPPRDRKPGDRYRLFSPLAALVQSWRTLSPAYRALLLASLAFFALFVTFDTLQALDAAQSRLQLGAKLLAHEVAEAPESEAPALMKRLPALLDDGTQVALIGQNSTSQASGGDPDDANRIEAHQGAGTRGTVSLSLPHLFVLAPVIQRALVGGALMVLLLLVLIQGHVRSQRIKALSPSLSAFLASLPHGAACWSDTGTLLAANQRFLDHLGDEGRFVHPGTPYAAALSYLSSAGTLIRQTENEAARTSELNRFDGRSFTLEERPMPGGGFVTLLVDITGQKTLEARLGKTEKDLRKAVQTLQKHKVRGDAASRSKVQFLAHLNHELRTPLNHIIGFAELIAQQSYGSVGNKRYLTYSQHIQQSGEALLGALSNMLELAEFNAGEHAMRHDPVRLRDLLAWSAQRFAHQAERAGITLSVAECDDLVLSGDRHLYQRMLGNIVSNALRFTPTNGEITLAAWTASDGVVLEISDTGVGIPPEKQDMLNQSFVLGDNAFKLTKDGGGLGIAIARAIAELSGGKMAINSTPALGTTVAISLPLAADDGRTAIAAA